MEQLKVVAINSFPVHGMAGLKPAIRILGHHVLPVPSVLLTGLTNIPGVKKQFPDFRELLYGALDLVVHQGQKVILLIGYIGQSSQVDVILELVKLYRSHIAFIYTDPISGDHARQYVSDEVVQRLPGLIHVSDFVFPNVTELKIITSFSASNENPLLVYRQVFEKQFPDTTLIVTSISEGDKQGVLLSEKGNIWKYLHPVIPKNYSGTGDTFVAYFIRFHVYHSLSVQLALQKAADKVREHIAFSMENNADELLIHQYEYNYAEQET